MEQKTKTSMLFRGGGFNLAAAIKGQLISKCPYEVVVWTKIATKIFPRFLF